MAKLHLYEATVEGTDPFPLDMLRYDNCWPTREGEVEPAPGTRRVHVGTARAVQYPVVDGFGGPFHDDRWASFGWHVIYVTVE
jgi:hypothetical protein